jgi:rare lipoprotein A (peptidoglycan hydrolase)
MERVRPLGVVALTGCLLVVSLCASCTDIHSLLAGPAAGGWEPDPAAATVQPPWSVQVGTASWYGEDFHGRPTASGEIYDMYQPTAAHRTVPLGTHAVVTNLANGHTVQVRINDRGPYRPGRILDLSYDAAQQLAMLHAGLARVQIAFLAAQPVDRRVPPVFPTLREPPRRVQVLASQVPCDARRGAADGGTPRRSRLVADCASAVPRAVRGAFG